MSGRRGGARFGGRGLPSLLFGLLSACKGSAPAPGSSEPTPGPALGWKEKAPAAPIDVKGRFVVLGFDGLDPGLVERWRTELPHLDALAREGTFVPLRTTNPPQSPVAWSTFATGTLPGDHGIFDFVARDPATMRPLVATTDSWDARWSADGGLESRAWGRNRRRGESFWLAASRAGVGVRVIDVPYAWPPDPVPHGGHASGLGTPDLRLTNSTSTVWDSAWSLGAAPDVGGVRTVPLTVDPQGSTLLVEGPRGALGTRSSVPVAIRPKEVDGRPGLVFRVAGQDVPVAVGAWSPFLHFDFPVAPPSHVRGQARFFVLAAGEDRTAVYQDPVGIDPEAPYLPLSVPPELARELGADAGAWKTVGWEEDTSAVNAGLLPDAVFLDEVFRVMDQRTQMAIRALDRGVPPLFISVWTGPDRISHLFWRAHDPQDPRQAALSRALGDPIREVYRRVDTIVGQIQSRIPKETTLLVLSDHGFHSFRRGLHVNTWLLEQGYLALAPGAVPGDKVSFSDIDWRRTRAYSLGTGQIYLNVRGREGRGTVPPQEAPALAREIAQALLRLEGEDGALIVRAVGLGDEIHAGPARPLAPDLQISFRDGWQTSWETRLGGVPEGRFAENTRPWSGEHAASAPEETRGVLLCNRALVAASPGIEDLAPTILAGLGLPLPAGLDGRDLFAP